LVGDGALRDGRHYRFFEIVTVNGPAWSHAGVRTAFLSASKREEREALHRNGAIVPAGTWLLSLWKGIIVLDCFNLFKHKLLEIFERHKTKAKFSSKFVGQQL
jgi:hypothetical protein